LKLAIISHTEHYTAPDGTLLGWSPTVNEINHLLSVFDTIYHVAMLHEGEAPASTMAYTSAQIHFVPLPVLGGTTLGSKLNTLVQAPKVIRLVAQTLKHVDYFQLRTPTGIGVYLIPYLTFFSRHKGWYKYAGNWNQKHAPMGYAIQRWFLKQQSRPVTINGQWPKQPRHCYSFENPCLTLGDIDTGSKVLEEKTFDRISFCYVGRLEKQKGVERIIKAFSEIDSSLLSRIGQVHLVGEGSDLPYFKALSASTGVSFVFHSALSRDEVFQVYAQSHVFLMPTTASEGFPKVIAEALSYGCIPVVSDLSSIGQYVTHNVHGFLINPIDNSELVSTIHNLLQFTIDDYNELMKHRYEIIHKFTFEYYLQHILKSILTNIN
jgi:glycosyltransferase involved in cell wall biosynthesis